MRLAPEGIREWGGASVLAAAVLVPLWLWCPLLWLNWILTGLIGGLWVFIIQFTNLL